MHEDLTHRWQEPGSGRRQLRYWQMKRYTLSLQEINKALEIDPSNYAAVNMRADIEVELGNYTAAKEDYTKLQRLNPRSLAQHVVVGIHDRA